MTIEVDVIIYIAGALISVVTAVGIITKLIKKTIASVSASATKEVMAEWEKKLLDVFNNFKEDIEGIRKQQKEDSKINRLRFLKNASFQISEAHGNYIQKGSIPFFVLANLEELFKTYVQSEGNSYAAICMDQIRKLPVTDYPDEKILRMVHEHEKED